MNSTQLNTLLDLTRIARDSAAARLARLEQQTQLAREHLQTLQGYSNDYAARLQARAGDQLDPAAQSNQRACLARKARWLMLGKGKARWMPNQSLG